MDKKPESDDYINLRKLLPRHAPKTEAELDQRVGKMYRSILGTISNVTGFDVQK